MPSIFISRWRFRRSPALLIALIVAFAQPGLLAAETNSNMKPRDDVQSNGGRPTDPPPSDRPAEGKAPRSLWNPQRPRSDVPQPPGCPANTDRLDLIV